MLITNLLSEYCFVTNNKWNEIIRLWRNICYHLAICEVNSRSGKTLLLMYFYVDKNLGKVRTISKTNFRLVKMNYEKQIYLYIVFNATQRT